METIIILSTVYLLSVYLMWRYMKIAHSKDGRWYNLDINLGVIFWTVCPVANTIMLFIAYLFFPPKNSKTDYNNFFKIKK